MDETRVLSKKTLIALFVGASLLCTLAVMVWARGCSKQSVERKIDLFSGTWELVKRKNGSSGADAETVKALAEHDLNVRLVLKKDGTGTLDLFGTPMDVTWKTRWGTTARLIQDGEKTKMRIDSEGMLVMEDGRESLTFKKLEDAEQTEPEEAPDPEDEASD